MSDDDDVIVVDDAVMVTDDDEYKDPKSALQTVKQELQQISRQMAVLQRRKTCLEKRRQALQAALQLQASAELAQHDWENEEYSWSSELRSKLESCFGLTKFRPHQLAAMNATLSRTHCILVMPTGGGKSLCYQLPAMLDAAGVTLVVSPLVSLMEDQLFGLRRRGLHAAMLSASSTKEETNQVMMGLTDPKWPPRLLYVTPERLAKSKRLMAKLQKAHAMARIARVAIDEVHCCSQWGHDFRPDYKFLGVLQQTFPGVPLLGLTATATARVITDVTGILRIPGCLVLQASFNRPNLFYEVRGKSSNVEECMAELCRLLRGRFNGQSGIIYTTTIKETLDIVKALRDYGIKVGPYHGQMESDERSKVHLRWINNEYQAVVATIAFGMGIDKPDVRFVIHHSVSKSMENYYQESGRAGRDGQRAECLLFWRLADAFKQSTMVFAEQTGLEKLYNMLAYCLDQTRCRRNLLSDHFGERWDARDCAAMCDHCQSPHRTASIELGDHLNQITLLLDHARDMDQRLTGQKIVDLWLGKGTKNMRVAAATNSKLTRTRAESVLVSLLLDGCLKEDFHFTPYSTISYIVLGPKADAGVAPSPLLITGQKKSPATFAAEGAHTDVGAVNKTSDSRKNAKKKVCKTDSSKNDIKKDASRKENSVDAIKSEATGKENSNMANESDVSNNTDCIKCSEGDSSDQTGLSKLDEKNTEDEKNSPPSTDASKTSSLDKKGYNSNLNEPSKYSRQKKCSEASSKRSCVSESSSESDIRAQKRKETAKEDNSSSGRSNGARSKVDGKDSPSNGNTQVYFDITDDEHSSMESDNIADAESDYSEGKSVKRKTKKRSPERQNDKRRRIVTVEDSSSEG